MKYLLIIDFYMESLDSNNIEGKKFLDIFWIYVLVILKCNIVFILIMYKFWFEFKIVLRL